MTKLNQIFNISYGTKLDYNKMTPQKNGIAFVSHSSKNNGIVDYVKEIIDVPPLPSGSITVTLGGTYLLSAFIQEQPFYTAQNIAVLTPKSNLSKTEILFYCTCLEVNRYRYSAFGREANVSLGEIELPERRDIPDFVKNFSIKEYGISMLQNSEFSALNEFSYEENCQDVPLSELFIIENGLASSQVERIQNNESVDCLPYIRPSYRQETGIDAYVNRKKIPKTKVFPAGTLYVSTDGQGSHTYAYVSTFDFVPNSNVAVLIPKREMSIQEKLFYAHCITTNRYKFSYGRKPKGDRLKTILLPEYPPQYISSYSFDDLIRGFNSVLQKL